MVKQARKLSLLQDNFLGLLEREAMHQGVIQQMDEHGIGGSGKLRSEVTDTAGKGKNLDEHDTDLETETEKRQRQRLFVIMLYEKVTPLFEEIDIA